MSDLLASLKPEHWKLVKWQGSETVFKFGNHGTLKSLGAVYVPFGENLFRIEEVQEWISCLISNAFLRFLGADLLISQSVLRVRVWGCDVRLGRNSKGLFTVCLKELIEAACQSEGHPCSVITWVSSNDTNNHRSREVYELCAGTGDQEPSASRCLDTLGMGGDEASRREVERIVVRGGILQGQQVCAVHDVSRQTGVIMGTELSKLCPGPGDGAERVPGDEAQDRN